MVLSKPKKMTKAEQSRRKFVENAILIRDTLGDTFRRSRAQIWGVDISLSNTGLTVYDKKSDACASFSHKLKGTRYQRLHALRAAFVARRKSLGDSPALVVIEGYAMNARFNRELMGEVGYAVRSSLLTKRGSPCIIVSPKSLKKYALGPGASNEKSLISNYVRNTLGFATKNHDESDSYVLCLIGRSVRRAVLAAHRFGILSSSKYDDKAVMKFLKDSPAESSMKKHQWEVVCDAISNDGDEIRRFYL